MPEPEITDNTLLHRFELQEDGETAFLLYSKSQNSLRLVHTEVPDALRGKGIGSKLVGGVLRLAKQNKLSVVPSCPFVAEYLSRHHEYLPIVEPEFRRRIQSSE